MTGNELRQAYLNFFESKGHLKQESYSLVPDNDPSLLLIGAGMAPLKPFFTGKLVPPCTRITTSQKALHKPPMTDTTEYTVAIPQVSLKPRFHK